jgi:CyaY protein
MDEREFVTKADAQLQEIEAALEPCPADIDFEMKPGGILELEFADSSKIIVNRHVAAREIWLAAKSGGFHFRWDGSQWIGTRDGQTLMKVLADCMSKQSGESIRLE